MANTVQYQLGYRSCHSTELVDAEDLYLWGGSQDFLPRVHDSEEKRRITTKADVFSLSALEWKNTVTTGAPPAGAKDYATAVIGKSIFFLGGRCDMGSCCHNELHVLNTDAKAWSTIPYTDGPMEKSSCGMISYCYQGSHYLLAIGGSGKQIQQGQLLHEHSSYVFHNGGYWTNEIHTMDMTTLPSKWRVPDVKGQRPPPLAYFTLDVLPHDTSTAVLFGGWIVMDGHMRRDYTSNELYILGLSRDVVEFTKLSPKLLSISQWPEPRRSHSSTILTTAVTDREESHLLVMGGQGSDWMTIADCWIMNTTTKRWSKIDLPRSVCGRYSHSVSSVTVKANTQWLIITGGIRMVVSDRVNVTGADVTVVVEIEYKNNDWSVTNIWNSEELVRNKFDIQSKLLHYIIEDRLHKGTVTMADLITNLQSTAAISLETTKTTREIEELLKEKQKEICSLQSVIEKLDNLLVVKDKELSETRKWKQDQVNTDTGEPDTTKFPDDIKTTTPTNNNDSHMYEIPDEVLAQSKTTPTTKPPVLPPRPGSFKHATHQPEKPLDINEIDQVTNCIRDEISKKYPALKELFENNLESIAGELLAVGLITRHVASNPSFDAIINGFLSGLSFLENVEQVQAQCRTFLGVFYNVGGPFSIAADNVKRQLITSLREKCNVSFNI